jgi:hypothetical protein
MGKSGGGAEESHGVSRKMHLCVAGGDEFADLFLGHAFLQIREDYSVNVAGGLTGEAHELELVRRFYGAATDGDWIGGDEIVTGSGGPEMIEEGKVQALFDADAASAETAVGEGVGEKFGGAFIFLPDANIGGIDQGFAETRFFEGGADEKRLAGSGNDQGEEAFAGPPVDAGEVEERSARTDEDGVEGGLELGHQGLCMEDARVEFVRGDGVDAVAEGFEGGEDGGGSLWRGVLGREGNEGGGGCGGCGLKEGAAGDLGHEVRGWGGNSGVSRDGRKEGIYRRDGRGQQRGETRPRIGFGNVREM